MNLAVVHMLLQLLPDPVVYWAEVRTVGWPKSWSDEVWCFNSFYALYGQECCPVSKGHFQTSDRNWYIFGVDIQRLITSWLKNIFLRIFAVLSKIYSESSEHNSVRMH